MTHTTATPAPDANKKPRAKSKRLPPALLGRVDAAAYLTVSASTLDRLNAAGEVPAPVRLGGRVAWCRRELSIWTAYGCPARPVWQRLWPSLRDRRPARK